MRRYFNIILAIAATLIIAASCSKEEEKDKPEAFPIYDMKWMLDNGTVITNRETIKVSSNGGKFNFKCIEGDYNSNCRISEETDGIFTSKFVYDCPIYTSSWYIADFTKPKELSLSVSPNNTKKKRWLYIKKMNGMWEFSFVFEQAAN